MRLRQFLSPSTFFYSLSYFPLLAFLYSALPVQSLELTPENFDSTTANGVWFIENFSPYCGHCKAFLPTWEELVKYNEGQPQAGIHLAQVNCVVHGGADYLSHT
jgi:thiol-disulfide isomerase/thioredoxin